MDESYGKIEVEKYIFNEIYNERIYEFISNNSSPIIIDCGANIGISISYFKQIFPLSLIFAFEANPFYYETLIMNIEKNLFEGVKTYNKAVSDTNGSGTFFISNKKNEFSIPITSLTRNEFADIPIIIETISFGNFIKQFDEVDFCKVDIEGGESLILKSLIENKVIHKIKEFVFEYHHWAEQLYKFDEFKHILEINNFEFFIVKEEPPIDGWSISGNTIIRAKNKLFH